MFTFKKLALVGVAGLAAFAMSCSDDEGSDAGSWKSFNATIDAQGDVALEGTITSNEGNISTLAATINGTAVTLQPPSIRTPDTSEVNLKTKGAYIDKIAACAIAGSATSIKVKVTATIGSSAISTDEKSVTISCGTGGVGGYSFTLGFASPNHSCVDLDGSATIATAGITAANILKVDLCSYVTSASDNKIYSPWDVDAFLDEEGDFIGSALVSVYNFSSSYSALNGATSQADLLALLPAIEAAVEGEEISESGLSITGTTAVLVESSEMGTFAVLVTEAPSGSVKLKAIDLSAVVE
jgi:hypothetical protein